MKIFSKRTHFDFIGSRRIPIAISVSLLIATLFVLASRGLNLGLDFTGGTLVEAAYSEAVEVGKVRDALTAGAIDDAVVQHFGTSRDVLIRLPVADSKDAARISNNVVATLRKAQGEVKAETVAGRADAVQQCRSSAKADPAPCKIQIRRIEFVGPQVGDELTEKGALALIYTLIAVLGYVMFRFEWRFAVAAVAAIAHDVLLTFGFFSLVQIEFDLTVLAAILAVLGYSLNDTIVVFDRIRENFHTMRKTHVPDIMNASMNQTLSRTVITSGTTVLAVLALLLFGGEIIRSFSIALIVGIFVGTYSSIYIATPIVLALGVSREDLIPPKKEGEGADSLP